MPPRDPTGPDHSRTRVKQVVVVAPAASDQAPVRSSSANPARCYYYIENTGTNLGVFTWDEAFPGQTNRGIQLLPGDWREWAIVVPIQAANFQSVLGTTFAVIEGWPPHG